MQATKVKIDPRLLNSRPLSTKRKTALRRKIVLDLIANRPHMTPLRLSEVLGACNYSSDAAPYMLLQSMVKDGLIERHDLGNRNIAYTIKTTKVVTPVPTPAMPTAETLVKPAISNEARAIRAVALEYFWQHKSDSLRQFVEWIEDGGASDIA